jgi:3-methylcrotonyl-CoA carboxylase alpha subunit
VALAAAVLLGALPEHAGFALWAPLWQDVRLESQGREIAARVSVGRTISVTVGEARHEVGRDLRSVDGRKVVAPVVHSAGVTVVLDRAWTFGRVDPLDRAGEHGHHGDEVRAPMPGLVRALSVRPGDRVEAGAVLGMMEAMKMELALRAPRAGRVAAVLTEAGAQVAQGAVLVRFEEEA